MWSSGDQFHRHFDGFAGALGAGVVQHGIEAETVGLAAFDPPFEMDGQQAVAVIEFIGAGQAGQSHTRRSYTNVIRDRRFLAPKRGWSTGLRAKNWRGWLGA